MFQRLSSHFYNNGKCHNCQDCQSERFRIIFNGVKTRIVKSYNMPSTMVIITIVVVGSMIICSMVVGRMIVCCRRKCDKN